MDDPSNFLLYRIDHSGNKRDAMAVFPTLSPIFTLNRYNQLSRASFIPDGETYYDLNWKQLAQPPEAAKAFSLCMWIRFVKGKSDAPGIIFSAADPGLTHGVYFSHEGNKKVRLYVGYTDNTNDYIDYELQENQLNIGCDKNGPHIYGWVYLVATWNSGRNMQLYVNGDKVADIPAGNEVYASFPQYIGKNPASTGLKSFIGSYNDVAFYSDELTQQHIQSFYHYANCIPTEYSMEEFARAAYNFPAAIACLSAGAPTVNGIAASVISSNKLDLMKGYPENVKVAFMVTAENIDGGYWNPLEDERDGCGMISGYNASYYANTVIQANEGGIPVEKGIAFGQIPKTTYYPGVKVFNVQMPSSFSENKGKHFRAVLSWTSMVASDPNEETNVISDLNLELREKSTSRLIACCYSFEGNAEVIDVMPSQLVPGGVYELWVRVDFVNFPPDPVADAFDYSLGWVHIVAQWKPGQFVRLYINGIKKPDENTMAPLTYTSDQSTKYYIGKGYEASPPYFRGVIEDINIYAGIINGKFIQSIFHDANYPLYPSAYRAVNIQVSGPGYIVYSHSGFPPITFTDGGSVTGMRIGESEGIDFESQANPGYRAKMTVNGIESIVRDNVWTMSFEQLDPAGTTILLQFKKSRIKNKQHRTRCTMIKG